MMEIRPRSPLPVTLLTGFLGSGKTTLVNRVLSDNHGRKIGVIVNEYGELGIDAALISGAHGSVIELANGCICCATQGDLARSLREILSSGAGVEALLIETSGLADPLPVVRELQSGETAAAYRLDGIITVVDAENFDRNLEHAEAAFQQIMLADLLVVNKVDLVGTDVPVLIEAGIRKINTDARFIHAVRCDIPADVALGIGGHADVREAGLFRHGHELDHHHAHAEFESISLHLDRAVDPELFTDWLDGLGPNVFRVKGFVRFAGNEEPVVVHVVGGRYSVEAVSADAYTGGVRLVVIGRRISSAVLRKRLERCVS